MGIPMPLKRLYHFCICKNNNGVKKGAAMLLACLPLLSEISDNRGKQWITIFFTNIAIPAPAPYGASLCLLGTPQSPAKCAAPFTKHTLYFAITPCGVAFRAGAAYVISLPSAGSCTSAQEGKKYVSLFMALAKSSLRFIAFFPIRHYNKTYHRREEKVCLLMKISNR